MEPALLIQSSRFKIQDIILLFNNPTVHTVPSMVPPTALDVASPSDIQIVTYSDKLTVNDVQARRSRAPKLGGGIAAHASSDMFKSPGSYFTESLFSTDGNFLGDEICFAALLASHSLFSLAL